MQSVLLSSWQTDCSPFLSSAIEHRRNKYLRFQAKVPDIEIADYNPDDHHEIIIESFDQGYVWALLPVGANQKWAVVTASGDLFKKASNGLDELEVSVLLQCRIYGPLIDIASLKGRKIDDHNYICTGTMNSSTFEPLQNGQISHVYMKIIADIPEKSKPAIATDKDKVDVSMAIPEPSNEGLACKKVLEDELFSDVSIYASNGAEIKTHRCFLSACSPVLKRMFHNEMKESRTGKVEMTDASEQGVRAFLRYLYYGDLKEPKEDIGVAFELLSAAHKYDVPSLEIEMVKCLLERAIEDFQLELAFKVYLFARNIESAIALKAKMVQFLRTKVDELESLDEYKELFKKDPNAAMEVFKDFVKSSSF